MTDTEAKTESVKATRKTLAKPGTPKTQVEDTLKLHRELIQGTLEVILGMTEAGSDLEEHVNGLSRVVDDNDTRIDKIVASTTLQNKALRSLLDASAGLLGRVQALEARDKARQEEILELRETNARLIVANIEIREVLYGQMTLEEWDKSSKDRDVKTRAFREGLKEG